MDEKKNDIPTAEVSVASTDANSAEIHLRTTAISEYAYLVVKDGEESTSDENVLFASGTTGTCANGDNTVIVTGLEPLTKYEVVFGFKTSAGEFLGDVKGAEFTTIDYTEDLTLVNTTPDGFSVHVKMPQSVLDNGNVLRYSAGNLVMYNYNKSGWMAALDASMLEANGGNYLEASSTITFNDDNCYALDENGDILLDEWGSEIQLHDPFVPGEPIVFMVGEFAWGESSFGWGEGWYSPLFDADGYYESAGGGMGGLLAEDDPTSEDNFWTGHFKRMVFTTSQPAVLDAKLNITHEAKATSAVLRVEPDEKVFQYCVLVMDNATYEGMVLPMLDNEDKYMQWFTTSYFAMMQLGAQTLSGANEIALEEYYYIEPEMEYHAFVTGMSDETGTTQCFEHYTFTTPAKTEKAPEIEVKHIDNPEGEESPWEIWFNVKSPSKNVTYAKYAANYERDWESALKYNTYSTIVAKGYSFTDEEVAKINSDEGFNIKFSSRDDAVTRLAVLGYNSEDTPNDIDSEDSKAIAEGRTIAQPDAERVESGLFEDLLGEWTASYKVQKYDSQSQSFIEVEEPMTHKVVITAGAYDYPETLPEEVYTLYSGMTREEVDALYAEFKTESEEYNAKVRGQNRLQCLGFGGLSAATPYELFTSSTYSGYNNEALFYDFGPKWYLQIAEDGSVTVPMNSSRMAPLSGWDKKVYYMAGLGEDGYLSVRADESDFNFPVTVSDDKSTITFKALEYEDAKYYPNAMYYNYNSAYLATEYKTVSDITLTKGWSGSEETSASSTSAVRNTTYQSVNGAKFTPMQAPKPKTPLSAIKKYGKSSMKIVTPEIFEQNAREYFASGKNARKAK